MGRVMILAILGMVPFLSASLADASPFPRFRTPAKRYGAAYSIKVSVFRNGVEFVAPMWVRPDQKESTLDPGQMAFMGWTYKDQRADEVMLSGQRFGKRQFKNSRSDWAVKPEYPENCCMGVIGQDFLSDYRLRFDPKAPVHIEWTHLDGGKHSDAKNAGEFQSKIRPLFSVKSEVVKIGAQHYDLGSTPFTLDFQTREIRFEKEPMALRQGIAQPIIRFYFSGSDRDLSVREVKTRDHEKARNLGLTEGARVTELNGSPVSGMNYYEIESLLRGKKGKSLEIGFLKDSKKMERSKVIFDFEKNEFIEPGTLQSPSRRN